MDTVKNWVASSLILLYPGTVLSTSAHNEVNISHKVSLGEQSIMTSGSIWFDATVTLFREPKLTGVWEDIDKLFSDLDSNPTIHNELDDISLREMRSTWDERLRDLYDT